MLIENYGQYKTISHKSMNTNKYDDSERAEIIFNFFLLSSIVNKTMALSMLQLPLNLINQ